MHDIGKLIGRSSLEMVEPAKHPVHSALFISSHKPIFSKVADPSLLEELVRKHHQNGYMPSDLLVSNIRDEHIRTLATLIKEADLLSSSERGEEGKSGYYKSVPLASVIEQLGNPGEKAGYYFHPAPFPSTTDKDFYENIFPERQELIKPADMNNLVKSWGESFTKYIETTAENLDFASFIEHLNAITYAHTWCLPSDTQSKIPDVSLYDHLKTTAAIAACLYLYHAASGTLDEKSISDKIFPRFLIVAGDISGIQKYIFDIPSSDAKGVARKLRSRSLFVQLCTEIAAHKILHRLKLPSWNLLMSSGGNFYILLPYLPETLRILEEVQSEIDRWFLHNLNGELALNLAWYAFGNDGFKTGGENDAQGNFSAVISEVKNLLAQKKQNRFAGNLQEKGSWRQDSFILQDFAGKTPCSSCKKYSAVDENGLCFRCQQDVEIGRLIPYTNFISFFAGEKSDSLPVLGYSVSLSPDPPRQQGPYLVVKLNNPDLNNIASHPAAFRYLANHLGKKVILGRGLERIFFGCSDF